MYYYRTNPSFAVLSITLSYRPQGLRPFPSFKGVIIDLIIVGNRLIISCHTLHCTVRCTFQISHFTIYTTHCTLYTSTKQYTGYSIHYKLYSVHCALYSCSCTRGFESNTASRLANTFLICPRRLAEKSLEMDQYRMLPKYCQQNSLVTFPGLEQKQA